MNTFLNTMKTNSNYGYTENGAVKHTTTNSKLLDMFAMGGAMRQRSEDDIILMFREAYAENPTYALKCLFYLRDVRGGQGERRFFRVCMRDLAKTDREAAARNLANVSEYGRWDDLYLFVGTPLETEMFNLVKRQLALDMQSKTPSLLAKWLKSENTSSAESRRLANKTRIAMGMSHKQYRKTLSVLRARINVLERLMSAGKWDEIEFDKIPSKAGLIYKNAFARRDMIKEKYSTFMSDKTTKVNAQVLNPVDIAHQVFNSWNPSSTDRDVWQKYWENLKDYYNGREENGLAIVDTSGSMSGVPMEAAVSMGAYIAERGHGPFANHFITFSADPELVEFRGTDIYDKFTRARSANWSMNTNIEAVFDMLLETAHNKRTAKEDMPETLYIFSDMEFDGCICCGPRISGRNDGWSRYNGVQRPSNVNTLIEAIAEKWRLYGYELPRIIFWNLNAKTQNIPALGEKFSYISGFSMSMIEEVLSGEDGYSLMLRKLDSPRYEAIH